MPAQSPVQPPKTWLVPGAAASVTAVPERKCALQVPAVQEMPAGVLVTVPAPATVTVSVRSFRNVAVTLAAADRATLHEPAPVQPPLQPANDESAAGVATRVTAVLRSNAALQVDPQLMPAGLEVTVPLPSPAPDTLSVTLSGTLPPAVEPPHAMESTHDRTAHP